MRSPARAVAWARRRARQPLAWVALLAGLAVVLPALLWVTAPDGSEYASAWPERTAYMELRLRQEREEGRELAIRYDPVPLSRIPEPVQRAVRVAEDAAFFQHEGVDWHEVRAAVREAWRQEEAPRGASTLTMQLARNLYLSPSRSFLRKLREVIIATKMEAELSKRRILELYLNVIELGPGVFGVEAAARRYWGVPVSALGPDRAARLAATIPSPRRDNPATATRRFEWRTRLVARRAFEARFAADTAKSGRYPPESALPPDTAEVGAAAGTDTSGPGADASADTAGPEAGGLPAADSVPAPSGAADTAADPPPATAADTAEAPAAAGRPDAEDQASPPPPSMRRLSRRRSSSASASSSPRSSAGSSPASPSSSRSRERRASTSRASSSIASSTRS